MAVVPTGAIYKALSFDNVSSRTYGVYITGQAVYNAPTRDVEMISIPGRNGAFALDHGRFENIEVSYPAGIFADNETDFAAAISNFRNFLCSRNGYVRLSDEYNPNEYRMAIYKSGLEVTPAQLKAGEFEIIFDCKPQRWLTSGETAITVSSGDTVTNPTLFDASPLLEVEGYGDININGETITIKNDPIGDVLLANETTGNSGNAIIRFDAGNFGLLNGSDTITLRSGSSLCVSFISSGVTMTAVSATTSGNISCHVVNSSIAGSNRRDFYVIIDDDISFINNVRTDITITVNITLDYVSGGQSNTYNATTPITISHAANNRQMQVLNLCDPTPSEPSGISCVAPQDNTIKSVSGYSTNQVQGERRIDLDIGEAYIIDGDTISSINNIVSLPNELPTLKAGANEIIYDNTVTELKVTPRWWKV